MSALAPTNVEVAELLGGVVTDSSVSRFRAGHRMPRMATRLVIEERLNWPIGDQARSEAAGTYAADFEARLCSAFSVDSATT